MIQLSVPEMYTPDRSLFAGITNLVPRSRSSIRAIRFAGNYGPAIHGEDEREQDDPEAARVGMESTEWEGLSMGIGVC
jgi:hypothetical protein